MESELEVPCSQNPKLFFPTPTRWADESLDDKEEVRQAKNICMGCHYKQSCLDLAVKQRESYGIWGGVHFGNRRERDRALRLHRSLTRAK